MKRARVAAAIALLAFGSFGCGAGKLVGLGRPAEPNVPPSAAFTPPEPPQQASSKKSRAEKQRDAKHAKDEARPSDDLGEAKLHASEQPSEPWWPYRAAELEAKAGRREASEASLREALHRDPGYPPALASLSRVLYEQGRHGEAIELLGQVRDGSVTLDDDDRTALLAGLALHEAAAGRDDRARAAMAQAGPDGRDGALAVSAYLAVRGESKETALERTAEAVRAAPKSAANHNNRGIALLRAADPDQAAKEFERAIELDPALPGPYYNLAILERFYRMDTAAATKRFKDYWSRSHADPDSLYAELGHGKPASVAEEGNPR
jgi:tetratricopeptide (TPR) repeat protein